MPRRRSTTSSSFAANQASKAVDLTTAAIGHHKLLFAIHVFEIVKPGSLAVEVASGPERRCVTVEGPARVEQPASAGDLAALDAKYARTDTAGWAGADYAAEAAIVITAARWIAWSYRD